VWVHTAPLSELGPRDAQLRVSKDLHLKALAFSSGAQIETPSFYRDSEDQSATAQCATKIRRAPAIDTKVKEAAKIPNPFRIIVIGNVSPLQPLRCHRETKQRYLL
jgi:hypothetical protein